MILQVSMFPAGEIGKKFRADEYPIIIDFEPKKREMYESATEAKQFMSQSRSNVNTQKGTKTTESTEVTLSAKVGGEVASAGAEYKIGTRTENVDMTTADHS
jgi:hypothetical protein